MKVTILVPTYNELHTIQEILRRVQVVGIAEEILVIDDGSTDGTRGILQDLDSKGLVRVIFHEKNQGKETFI